MSGEQSDPRAAWPTGVLTAETTAVAAGCGSLLLVLALDFAVTDPAGAALAQFRGISASSTPR